MTTSIGASAPGGFAWPASFAFTTVAGTLATACMMPFVGLAVVAAWTLPLRSALATVAVLWLTNQLLGFGLLGYPVTAYALAWGFAIGVASMAATLVARTLAGDRHQLVAGRLIGAFAMSFATYEGLLYAFAQVAGGVETFTPAIILRIATNDAGWLVALVALRMVLTLAAPRHYGAAPGLRLA